MWLVIYFAPWCHQCITNRIYMILAARKLQASGLDVRVGAVRCAVPREGPNTWCGKELKVPEHPTFRALARGFATELGVSLPQPMVPELIYNFTVRAALQLRRQRLTEVRGESLPALSLESASSEEFVGAPQLVVFVDAGRVNASGVTSCPLCDAARGMAAALGPPLLSVSYALCAPNSTQPQPASSAGADTGEDAGKEDDTTGTDGSGPGTGRAASGAASGAAGGATEGVPGSDGASFDYTAFPDNAAQAREHDLFQAAALQAARDAEWFAVGGGTADAQLALEGALQQEEEEEAERAAHRLTLQAFQQQQRARGLRVWEAARAGVTRGELQEV